MGIMERIRFILVFLTVAAVAGIGAPLNAQVAQEIPTTQWKVRPVRETALHPMPFSPDVEYSGAGKAIKFLSVDQMIQSDRDLAADAEASINEHAGFDGLEFNEGKWNYQELVCKALPGHMFLKFTRNNGSGDVSMFTASIPRGGDGRVRIIPILRRGYSLFSPAPINALTISAFNHIRAEERAGNVPNWLDTALCYAAAVTGAHPRAAMSAESADIQTFVRAMGPVMDIPYNGGAIIHFSDIAEELQPIEWTMTFDGKGRLLKVSHRPAVLLKAKIVSPNAAETQGITVAPARVN